MELEIEEHGFKKNFNVTVKLVLPFMRRWRFLYI